MKTDPTDFLNQVFKRYEEEMGESLNTKTRLRPQVEHRVALSNALKPYATLGRIGKLFNKHHATVIHYQNEHEGLLQYSPQYRRKYAVALYVTNNVADDMDQVPTKCFRHESLDNPAKRVEDLERLIEQMTKMKNKIKSLDFV